MDYQRNAKLRAQRFADERASVADGMYSRGEISIQDMETRHTEAKQAALEVETSQGLVDTCREREPSLEFLEDLARRDTR